MKQIAGLICLASFSMGVLVLFGGGFALSALVVAVYRAPQGEERSDGFHMRRGNRRPRLVRHIRFSQPAHVRQRGQEMDFRIAVPDVQK